MTIYPKLLSTYLGGLYELEAMTLSRVQGLGFRGLRCTKVYREIIRLEAMKLARLDVHRVLLISVRRLPSCRIGAGFRVQGLGFGASQLGGRTSLNVALRRRCELTLLLSMKGRVAVKAFRVCGHISRESNEIDNDT